MRSFQAMVMANEIVEPDVTWKGISLEWVVRIVLTMTISPCGTRANFALHTHVSNKRVSRRPAGALVQGPGISSWQTRRLNSLKKVEGVNHQANLPKATKAGIHNDAYIAGTRLAEAPLASRARLLLEERRSLTAS